MNNDHQPEIPLPPVDGTLTVLEALDFQCQHNPAEPIYLFSAEENAREPTKITFHEFGRACDWVSQLIHPNPPVLSVVGVILVTDVLQYQVTLLGLMKAGFVPFPISHQLSSETIVHLLRATSCHNLIVTSATLPSGLFLGIKDEINRLSNDYHLRFWEMPDLNFVSTKPALDGETNSPERCVLSSRTPSLDELALYLHSSGRTGIPKPIPQTHKRLCQWASVSDHDLRMYNPRLRMSGMGLPPFDTIGFFLFTLLPIYHGISVPILPPVDTVAGVFPLTPSPDIILDHIKRTKSTALMTIPAFLNAWTRSKDDVIILASLNIVCFGGGFISNAVGDSLVSAGVNLQSMYGTTETGPISRYGTPPGSDWAWMEIWYKMSIEWFDQGNGIYECHCLKGELHEPAVINRSDEKGLVLSDLFIKHPTKDNLWKIVCRKDDVIIHASGIETLPGPVEEIIASSPLVRSAVVFGRGRDNAGILVEVHPEFTIGAEDSTSLKQLRNCLWPCVEVVNKILPGRSRISEEMILITRPDKPLAHTPKGTTMRKPSLEIVSSGIETLYEALVFGSSSNNQVEPPVSWGVSSLKEWLIGQLSQMFHGKSFNISTNLFEQGCDSLAATLLHFRISNFLKARSPSISTTIPRNVVYAYPTIEGLARYLSRVVIHQDQSDEKERCKKMDAMIAQYSIGPPIGPSAVLLTGSTGHLGCHLLASLTNNSAVHRIYALNRPNNLSVEERHRERFRAAGLDLDNLKSSKILYVEVDLSVGNLGLSKELYDEIQQSVTLIIYASWKLNFSLPLASFEPHIRGVRNLVDLARQGPHFSSLRFVFTSSISVAQSWDLAEGPYPETIMRQSKYSIGTGYGESKYVAERILESSGLNVCSIRLVQLSGTTTTGMWATTNWLPILVKSSISLGGLPSIPGLVSWLPTDCAAHIILDVALSEKCLPFAMNLVHPYPVPWARIIEGVQSALVKIVGLDPIKIPVIPFSHWLDKLSSKTKDATPEHMKNIPALKLIDFFREAWEAGQVPGSDVQELGGLPTLASQKMKESSPLLQTASPLQTSDVQLWVKYWKDSGFLL